MNSFLKGTLKGNELRRTVYHIKNCPYCKEVLLDEFSFYMTFNDLDKDLNFNYEKKMNELLNDTEQKIVALDSKLKKKYVILSILLCFAFMAILTLALRLMYR
ncbi:MAG: hypothetical protein II411_05590 [Lachnospiraceae bacterium]|nr:hypothetical protein [Lachnospiraceae bacterium]